MNYKTFFPSKEAARVVLFNLSPEAVPLALSLNRVTVPVLTYPEEPGSRRPECFIP